MTNRTKIGVAVIGFGWMGQAHTRSYIRIPTLFPERTFDPELIVVSDNMASRVDEAVESFGFREGTTDWRQAIAHPDVDVVCICAPNMLHEPIAVAAVEAGRHGPGRIQLPLGAAGAVCETAGRGRNARRDHQLQRPFLHDVRL